MIEFITVFLAIAVLIIATIYDKNRMIIPNWITLPIIPIGLILTAINDYTIALSNLLVIVILFFLGMTGIFGMGDLKLIMTIVSLQSFLPTIIMLLVASALFVYQKVKIEKNLINMKRVYDKKEQQSGTKYPFAPYMLIGYIFYLCMNYGSILYKIITEKGC